MPRLHLESPTPGQLKRLAPVRSIAATFFNHLSDGQAAESVLVLAPELAEFGDRIVDGYLWMAVDWYKFGDRSAMAGNGDFFTLCDALEHFRPMRPRFVNSNGFHILV